MLSLNDSRGTSIDDGAVAAPEHYIYAASHLKAIRSVSRASSRKHLIVCRTPRSVDPARGYYCLAPASLTNGTMQKLQRALSTGGRGSLLQTVVLLLLLAVALNGKKSSARALNSQAEDLFVGWQGESYKPAAQVPRLKQQRCSA
jgi:hypothetical protein